MPPRSVPNLSAFICVHLRPKKQEETDVKINRIYPSLCQAHGSAYTDSVLAHAAWTSGRLDAPVRALHVQPPTLLDHTAPTDLSGAIGLGAKTTLLDNLSRMDERHGKLDQQRGELILDHARAELTALGVANVQTMQRRGSLVDSITELESSTLINVLGKHGENVDFASGHLGSDLERAVRAAHKPVLVATRAFNPIQRFVIAYDGGPATRKAVDYVATSPLFQGLECHLLHRRGRSGRRTVWKRPPFNCRRAVSAFRRT